MNAGRVAKRYSTSLINLALEKNILEQVKEDAVLVVDAVNNSRELKNFLASPIIKPLQKGEILAQIFNKSVTELTAKFIQLLVKKGRVDILFPVFNAFLASYRDHHNLLEADFITASKVDANTVELMKQKLDHATGKNVVLKESVNADLIGGYIVNMQNYRLDASLAGGLQKLKRELTK